MEGRRWFENDYYRKDFKKVPDIKDEELKLEKNEEGINILLTEFKA